MEGMTAFYWIGVPSNNTLYGVKAGEGAMQEGTPYVTAFRRKAPAKKAEIKVPTIVKEQESGKKKKAPGNIKIVISKAAISTDGVQAQIKRKMKEIEELQAKAKSGKGESSKQKAERMRKDVYSSSSSEGEETESVDEETEEEEEEVQKEREKRKGGESGE